MSVTISLYEDTGALTSGHGSTQSVVENIGWKSSGTDESSHYVYNPIIRPQDEIPFTYSYKKYNYMKIEGTYPIGSRPRIKISNGITGAPPDGMAGCEDGSQLRLYYKLTNIYEQPNNQWDGTMIFLPAGDTIIYPAVSTTGPEAAVIYPHYLSGNTTYYTQYLVTQLIVGQGTSKDFGNIGEVNMEWYMDEYEDTNV